MTHKVRLGDFTWQEVEALLASDPVVVIPVGAFEQHGHHLPLRVDAHLVGHVCEAAVARASERHPAVVTPTVWAGFSPHHRDFPGTISLDDHVFSEVVGQVAQSLNGHGFRRIAILNGHGGNANLLKNLIQTLRYDHGISAATANYWDFALDELAEWRQSESGGIMHACEMETSLMLATEPDLVQMDKAVDVQLDRSRYLGADLLAGGPVSAAASFKELSSSGVIGAPTLASGERGQVLLDAMVTAVAQFIEDFATWPIATNSETAP